MYLVGLDCRLSNSLGLEAAVEFLHKAVKQSVSSPASELSICLMAT